MGCCVSIQGLDYDQLHSPVVLQTIGENTRYHGTTERNRLQTLGSAELVLTNDGIYSQVIGSTCCGDRGFLHIPLLAIREIREQAWFNGLYRLDRPHLVVTYVAPGQGECQAGWQMNQAGYEQWRRAIEILVEQNHISEPYL